MLGPHASARRRRLTPSDYEYVVMPAGNLGYQCTVANLLDVTQEECEYGAAQAGKTFEELATNEPFGFYPYGRQQRLFIGLASVTITY